MQRAVQVHKFGGASLKDVEGIRNVGKIIKAHLKNPAIIVVSAFGKTTNALELVVDAFANSADNQEKATEALLKFQEIKEHYYQVAQEVSPQNHGLFNQLNDLFVEVDWLLECPFDQTYDYVYDQIIGIGELASSAIVAAYLKSLDLNCEWQDVRGLIKTDELYREAWVNWDKTTANIQRDISKKLEKTQLIVTQGFIGSSDDNETTTLGREGSDYSAAIFSFCLGAESMTIWKDVPGILTADPRTFDNVTKLDHLSYTEAIEMTYYGAKVIHPKTIKPLQNKAIPLFVKCFSKPSDLGTRIDADAPLAYPPIITIENNQALIQISTRDFSFVAEHHLKDLFNLIAEYRLQVNLMQNSAISFSISVNDQEDRVDRFVKAISDTFSCTVSRDLELITLRHADQQVIESLVAGKMVLMDTRVGKTVQMVVRPIDIPKRKG